MWFLYICADIVITSFIALYILWINWMLSRIFEGRGKISFASSFISSTILLGLATTTLLIEWGILP